MLNLKTTITFRGSPFIILFLSNTDFLCRLQLGIGYGVLSEINLPMEMYLLFRSIRFSYLYALLLPVESSEPHYHPFREHSLTPSRRELLHHVRVFH